ncbi:MAG: tetratricopeptide repeat protein [Pseudomonadota bacterium]
MANEDSALREVDQELAEDRQWAMFRRYGPIAIGAGAAIVVGVGAYQFYNASQTRSAEAAALEFNAAVETLETDPGNGRSALQEIAAESGSGYGLLASFRRASSLAAADERAAAIEAFRTVYQSGGSPASLRDLARLRAAHLALADGRDAALAHLGEIPESSSAFRFHADEIVGIAALEAEDYQTALSIFERLSADPATPPPVAGRAEEFRALAVAGVNGVNLTGDVRLDDIIGAVGPSLDPVVVDAGLVDEIIGEVAPEPATQSEDAAGDGEAIDGDAADGDGADGDAGAGDEPLNESEQP